MGDDVGLVNAPSEEPVGARMPLWKGLASVSYGVMPLSVEETSEVVRLKPFWPPVMKSACMKRPNPPRSTVLGPIW